MLVVRCDVSFTSFFSLLSYQVVYHQSPILLTFCSRSPVLSQSFEVSLHAVLPSQSPSTSPPFSLHITSVHCRSVSPPIHSTWLAYFNLRLPTSDTWAPPNPQLLNKNRTKSFLDTSRVNTGRTTTHAPGSSSGWEVSDDRLCVIFPEVYLLRSHSVIGQTSLEGQCLRWTHHNSMNAHVVCMTVANNLFDLLKSASVAEIENIFYDILESTTQSNLTRPDPTRPDPTRPECT